MEAIRSLNFRLKKSYEKNKLTTIEKEATLPFLNPQSESYGLKRHDP